MAKEQGIKLPVVAATTATGFLQNNWKWILGFGTVGFFGWLVYDKFFANTNVQLEQNPNFPASTLTNFEAQKAADTLYNAMKNFGTNEALIFSVLEGKTQNDFVKISNAFGVRKLNTTTGEHAEFIGEDLGLYEWLRSELNHTDLQKINAIAPGLITANVKARIGDDVAATENNLKAYKVDHENGVWKKQTAFETYHKLEKIGEVLAFVTFEGQEWAIIDQPWSFQELIVPTNKIALI